MVQSKGAHFGNIVEGNPTDRLRAGCVNAGGRLWIIEAEGRTEPDFHKPASLDDGEVHPLKLGLDPPLGLIPEER
jgi:hypothetical protein